MSGGERERRSARRGRRSCFVANGAALAAVLCARAALADPVPSRTGDGTNVTSRNGEGYDPVYWAARNWREGDPPPPGYHLEPRPWTGMIVGGAIPLGVAYAFSIMGATMAGFSHGSTWLLLPVAGPWLMAATLPGDTCNRSYDVVDCYPNDALRGILVFDGIVQTLGMTLVLIGAETEKHRLVHDAWSLSLRPLRIGTGYGVGLGGDL